MGIILGILYIYRVGIIFGIGFRRQCYQTCSAGADDNSRSLYLKLMPAGIGNTDDRLLTGIISTRTGDGIQVACSAKTVFSPKANVEPIR